MRDFPVNPEMRWVVHAQTGVFGLMLMLASLFAEPIFVFSVLVGGLIALIPSYLMVWWFFSYQGAALAQRMLRAFYGVELIKWLLALVGFSVLFGVFGGDFLGSLEGFLGVQSVVWFLTLRGMLGKK